MVLSEQVLYVTRTKVNKRFIVELWCRTICPGELCLGDTCIGLFVRVDRCLGDICLGTHQRVRSF